MRRLLLISLFFCAIISVWAQAPEKINFQTVLHYTEGSVIPNQEVKLIVNILAEEADGDIVYREEHSIESNDYGLINLKIGDGEVLYGQWSDIAWSEEDQFIMLELDSSGTGSSFMDMGVTKMLSVPYALYAETSTVNDIWNENDLGVDFDGDMGIHTDNPSEDIELGEDSEILVSSDMTNLLDNDLIKIGMNADSAQANINWRSADEEFGAALSAREYTTDPLTLRKHFLISTADENSSRNYRMEIKYDEDIADILFNNSNLIVDGQFITGDEDQGPNAIFWSHNWIKDTHVLGLGDKDWKTDGVYGDAAAEIYSMASSNFVLLHSANELKRAQLKLRRGNSEWIAGVEDIFYFKRNDSKKMKIMPDGKVKIGSNDPNYKLDVYGDINIPLGYSYMIGGGKSNKYAEYFESEEQIEIGELVGINPETGLARIYQNNDVLVGIACESEGFVGNAKYAKSDNYTLVGLEGMMDFKSNKVQRSGVKAFTHDGQFIGAIMNNQIYIK